MRFCLLALLSAAAATEIQIKIPAAGTRCFGEELQAHDLLVVKVNSISPTPPAGVPPPPGGVTKPTFNLVIKMAIKEGSGSSHASSAGNVVYKEDKQSSVSHAFTSTAAGPHWVCITNLESYMDMDVMLNMKSGVYAKDYGQIAKKYHLEPAQVAVRRMSDLLNEYRSNLFYQRSREQRMRETVDSTADRALVFCILNTLMIVGVGLFQAYFFRKFFRSKKII